MGETTEAGRSEQNKKVDLFCLTSILISCPLYLPPAAVPPILHCYIQTTQSGLQVSPSAGEHVMRLSL